VEDVEKSYEERGMECVRYRGRIKRTMERATKKEEMTENKKG
jgi:hypothetical protein